MRSLVLIGLLILTLINESSYSLEVAGVSIADKEVVGSETLSLHGTGIRKVFFGIKVYVGAFYYPSKLTSEEELLKSPKMFFLRLKFLRDVSKEKIIESFKSGFEKNKVSTNDYSASWGQLSQALDNLNKGEELTFSFDGQKLIIKCKTNEITINQVEFVPQLLKLWFGTPPNSELKKGLLNI